MKLSIIIVSWNTKTLLKSCLESIAAPATPKRSDGGQVNSQPSNVNYEIIVVDNNSSDNSVEFVRKFKAQNPKFKINLIENKKNLGFSKAVNQGIEIANGKYILLLNSDTKIKPKEIDELVEFAESKPHAGVVGPQLINPDGTIQSSCYNFPTIANAVKEFWLGQENKFSKYYPKINEPTEVNALVGAVFLITDKSLKKIGKLDEKYFLYYEDIDYCKRVWQAELKVYYLPSVRVLHEHGASGKKNPQKTSKLLIESSKKYHGVVKHYLINAIIWIGQKVNKI